MGYLYLLPLVPMPILYDSGRRTCNLYNSPSEKVLPATFSRKHPASTCHCSGRIWLLPDRPDVDGLQRLQLTPKLFDWFVDASRCFRRRRRDSFSTAIATRLITAWLISLSVFLKHNGTTSRLGIFDCSLSGQTFLFVDLFLFVDHAN